MLPSVTINKQRQKQHLEHTLRFASATMSTMPVITKLPCEIINAVLRHMGSVQNLSSALLTCQHFYASFKENPHIALDMLQQQIPSTLLPYAIAVMDGSSSRFRPPTDRAVQVDPAAPATQAAKTAREQLLNELHTEPSKLTSRLPTMPLAQLSHLSHTHDIIHGFVTAFANSAWAHLSREPGGSRLAGKVSLSPAEYFRFCRAFYRIELYFRLFRAQRPNGDGALFLSKIPPWENEQLGCVQDFLELQLSKGLVAPPPPLP